MTSSYCWYSLELERNSWLSESSILMRSMPKTAATHQRDQDDAGQDRRPDRDQADALQARRRCLTAGALLDLLDVDLTVGVLIEHALSSSHIGSISNLGSRVAE